MANIIPALPVNMPGAPGSIAPATTVPGTYADWIQEPQEIVPLATKKSGEIDEPAYSPPVNFGIQTSG